MGIINRSKHVSPEQLTALLTAFFEGSKVNAEGAVQYLRYDFSHLFEMLPDAFEVTSALTPKQMQGVLSQALLQCRKAGHQSEEALVDEAERLAKKELAKKPSKFTLWTKFRARQMPHVPGFKMLWNGVSIRSARKLPRYLQVQDYFLSGYGHVEPEEPVFYGYVIFSTQARDDETAVGKMLDALHLFYGLFNIYARWGQVTHHSGLHWTDGPLWLGPYQFVFRGKNFLSERLWYNPDYLQPAWTRSPLDMKKVLEFLPRVKKSIKALATHPLQDALVRTIILFQDGFAARDASHRLLRYWSALEQLYSDDPRNRNQQLVIKRASFAEPSPALERWKLRHAAHLRNEHVHAGELGTEVDASTEHLRDLLSRHINHLILRRGDLANHAEWLELVDFPPNRKRLAARKTNIDRRSEYFPTDAP